MTHCCPTCKQALPSPVLTECQQLVLDDVRENPGTSAKAIYERLSSVRSMYPTTPQIMLDRLMEKKLVRREKGFRRRYAYFTADIPA
jgi:predicted transcriptional regulator